MRGPTQWALEELRESDPQWVSEWLARKFLDGSTRFGGWNEMVTQLPAEERERLLARFSNELLEPNEQRRMLSLLATTADGGLAARVFERACEIRRRVVDRSWSGHAEVEPLPAAGGFARSARSEDFPRRTVTQAGERAGR